MTILEVSGQLIENTVQKMSLTSVLLAASVFTLTLGYLSKLLFRQQQTHTGDQVRAQEHLNIMHCFQICVETFNTACLRNSRLMLGSLGKLTPLSHAG